MEKSKSCFIISPIGSVDTPQRKRADTVLKYIFKPAMEPLGYEVVRADEISTPGSITLQVLERVLESALVIADLTDHNPNVFYELAVRHAVELPVIHVIAADQKIPFDVADLRTIPIDIDLDGANRSVAAIVAQTRDIEAGRLGETPIKIAGALKHLSAGKSDEKLILKQLLEAMTEMKGDLRKLIPAPLAGSSEKTLLAQIGTLSRSLESLGEAVQPEIAALIREAVREMNDEVVYLAKSTRKVGSEEPLLIDYAIVTKAGRMAKVTLGSDIDPMGIVKAVISNIH